MEPGGIRRRVWTGSLLLGSLLFACACSVIIPQPRDEYVNGRLKIVYWEKWTGYEGQAIQRVVDRFNEIQEELHVHLITMSQIDQKALVSIAGGDPPDLVGLWSNGVPAFAAKGALTPLDALMERAGMNQDEFLEAFLRVNTWEGQLYGLPTTPATVALHWNKAIFREVGLDPEQPPRTLQELDEMAEQLTLVDAQGRLQRLGFMPAEPGWFPWAWGYWFGGTLFDGENLTIDSPENLAAFKWVHGYTERYGAEEMRRFQSGIAGQFATPQNAFFSGKVAMVLQGVWMANYINNYAPDMEWGAAPFPAAVPGLEMASIADCDSIVIPVGARHPQEAMKFIKYLCSQEGYEILNLGQGKFTPLKAVSEAFLEGHPNPYIQLFIDLAKSPNAFHQPIMSLWAELSDEMGTACDMVMYGLDTPERVLAKAQERMDAKWQREKRRMALRKDWEEGREP